MSLVSYKAAHDSLEMTLQCRYVPYKDNFLLDRPQSFIVEYARIDRRLQHLCRSGGAKKRPFLCFPENSGWGRLWKTYNEQLHGPKISQYVTTGDVQSFLDSRGVRYQRFELPSQMDITECFTQGDENGELLLDFLTEVLNFSKTAPPKLRAEVMDFLRHPDCSEESNGRVMFNNNLGAIVLDGLPCGEDAAAM